MTTGSVIWGGAYAKGAEKATLGKPLYDGDIDRVDVAFPAKIRKQNHWLNVNTTDIPTVVKSYTSRTIGITLNTQVESPSRIFNDKAENLIEKFNRIKIGELTGRHHFASSMRLISDFEILDGGVIIKHHYNKQWEIPYKYEVVSVDMIDASKNYNRYTEDDITVAGIQLNKWNQITHLWLYEDENKLKSKKVPIEDITYYSEVWVSVGQQVAISQLSSMLSTMDKVYQYANAELEAAIEEAKAGAYIKSTAFNEIIRIATDEIGQMSDSEKAKAELQDILKGYARLGVGHTGLTPIPAEDEVQFNTAKRDGVFSDLNSNAELKMASSQGMSDLGMYKKADKANYSSLKYAIETDQLSADIRFDNISNKVIDEIYTRLLRVGVQLGILPERVSFWSNQTSYAKFRYLRKNKIDVEPGKTATANKTNLELGIKDEATIIEQAEGIKYETFLSKKEKHLKMKIDSEIKLEIYQAEQRKTAYAKANIDMPEENQQNGDDKDE